MAKLNKYDLLIGPRLDDIAQWKLKGYSNEKIALTLGVNISTFQRSMAKHEELRNVIEDNRKTLELEIEASYLEIIKRGYTEEEELITTPKGDKVLARKVKRKQHGAKEFEFALKLLNPRKWIKGELEGDVTSNQVTFGGGEDDI